MSYMVPPTSYYGLSEDEIRVAKEGERLRDMYAPGTDAHELGRVLIRVAFAARPKDETHKRICPACFHSSMEHGVSDLIPLRKLGETEIVDGVTEEAWKCNACGGYIETYWLREMEE